MIDNIWLAVILNSMANCLDGELICFASENEKERKREREREQTIIVFYLL
jgi:hypothetical protein